MLYTLMLLGIGFLSACVLMVVLVPLIHERAVRLTVRRLSRPGPSRREPSCQEPSCQEPSRGEPSRREPGMR